ncbi:DNA recombination protein RmuC [Aeromicrobium sp.]|uniref:DNA recombination protein RmuC n=1 Tax=Aeromicrobium sp. TaxID=1871063 RepID=UPI003D6ACB47
MDLVIVLLIGLLVGFVLGWLWVRSRPDVGDVAARLATAMASRDGLQRELDAAREQYSDLMERTRREAQERVEAERRDSKVLSALAPVQEALRTMHQDFARLDKQRSEQHGDLAAHLRITRETAEKSKLAAETLASALRNNSVRGVYGETQLKSLVESAGLLRRVDFTTQESIESESGARRPDMVIHLPGGKQMAIDAKVPYTAFIESNRPDLTDAQRAELLTRHAKQVKAHIDALAGKTYWSGLSASPEFTVAFIPNESILNSALDADPSLMEYAFSKGVLLATPVNLWAVLKTVAFTWQQDVLTEDAKHLFDLGKELYARLAKLAEHSEKLRRSIESTVANYNNFASSLEQRVLVTARKLDQVDESKIIAAPHTIDAQTKRLTQEEFAAFEDLERPELDFALEAEIVDDDSETG